MDSKTLMLQYLDEAHAMETALVTNLGAHIAMTTDAEYRELLERHLGETKAQVANIEKRRQALGATGGRNVVAFAIGLARDAIGQVLVLSKGPLDGMRTTSQAERMLKNAKDECATEALEIATYDALETAAKAAGDKVTARLATEHRAEEERMLTALRGQIARLAVATVEQRTDTEVAGAVKAAATRKAAAAA